MKRIFFLIFSFVLLIYGCAERPRSLAKIDFKYAPKITEIHENIAYTEIVDNAKYIKLESTAHSVLSDVQSVKLSNEKIFVQAMNGLFAFDLKGKFLFEIGRIGHGPAEYLAIAYLSVSDGVVRVFDYQQKKIINYSAANGKFLNYDKLRNRFYKAAKFSNSVIGFTGEIKLPFISNDTRIVAFNMENQDQVIPLLSKSDYGFEIENQFTDNSHDVYWTDPLWNRVYKISSTKITGYFHPDFKGKSISSNTKFTSIEDLADSHNFFYLSNFNENSSICISSVVMGKSIYKLIYNKLNGDYKVYNAQKVEGDYCDYAPDPIAVYGNYFVSVIPANEAVLLSKLSGKKHHPGHEQQYEVFNKTKFEDNPIIVFHSIKTSKLK